ncbi:RNA polymerase sigma factor [Polaribacter ponticola]|uniref:RNA polymerase sigma factor n=1 Tax=Polaribacter ponticola TaxID=2978475 RepID=UPI0030824EC3
MKISSVNSLTDEELVFKIVETNNSQLFAILYDRFSKVVYNKCYGFSKNKEEAEDLTHDVFIRLFVKLKTFKGNSKFSTWLYSFTYNFCVNYVQRNTHKKRRKLQ